MSEKPKTWAQKSVAWQNRYLTPVLVVIALVFAAVSWAAGGISWWVAVVLLVFGAVVLVSVIKRNRR